MNHLHFVVSLLTFQSNVFKFHKNKKRCKSAAERFRNNLRFSHFRQKNASVIHRTSGKNGGFHETVQSYPAYNFRQIFQWRYYHHRSLLYHPGGKTARLDLLRLRRRYVFPRIPILPVPENTRRRLVLRSLPGNRAQYLDFPGSGNQTFFSRESYWSKAFPMKKEEKI